MRMSAITFGGRMEENKTKIANTKTPPRPIKTPIQKSRRGRLVVKAGFFLGFVFDLGVGQAGGGDGIAGPDVGRAKNALQPNGLGGSLENDFLFGLNA
jgi:hypothetical protein